MMRFFCLAAVLFALVFARSEAAVRIVAPTAGSKVLVGVPVTIKWDGATGTTVSLWYSTNGQNAWTLIASGITADNYVWTVPEFPFDSIAFRITTLAGASPTPLVVFRDAHIGEIRTASFSRDGRLLLSAGKDGFVKVRDLATGVVDSAPIPNGGEIYTAKFAGSTDSVFINQQDRILLWDRVRKTVETTFITGIPNVPPNFRALDIFPERSLIVTGGANIIVWDYKGQRIAATTSAGPSLIYTVAFSHDGTRVVYAGDDGAVYEWAWETADPARVYRQHGSGSLNLVVWSCAFAPSDAAVASGGVDATVQMWSRFGGNTSIRTFQHNSHVRSVGWSPDGSRLLSGSLDSTIRQWDPLNGELIGAPLNHGGQVIATAYSPTGDTILSAGRDGAIVLWKSGFSSQWRDTAFYALGKECVLEVPHLTGSVGKAMYIPLVWRNRIDVQEFMTAEGVATIELPNTLLETLPGGNTIERRRGKTRDTVLLPVRPGIPGDTIAVIAARVLLGVPVRQDIRILSVEWEPGIRLVPTTVDGSITVQDTCGLLTLRAVGFTERTALSVAPNPATDGAFATFTLAVDEPPKIAIYDARGVEVGSVERVPSQAGVHTVALPVERLTTGEYFVHLFTGGRQYSAKLTVVR